MHNCKSTRDLAAELLLDRMTPPNELLVELRDCSECREEVESLKHTLRATTRIIESTAAPEVYWQGYHARLREKLESVNVSVVSGRQPSWLKRILTTSVRIPVPVGAALILLFAVSLFFAARRSNAKPVEALVLKVPVEVQVIQEKVVTRVVYRDRYRRSVERRLNRSNGATSERTLARSQKNDAIPTSLLGFKPLEEIKLTVIKGGGNDK